MTLLLILGGVAAWLLLTTLIVCLCVMAGRGDAPQGRVPIGLRSRRDPTARPTFRPRAVR